MKDIATSTFTVFKGVRVIAETVILSMANSGALLYNIVGFANLKIKMSMEGCVVTLVPLHSLRNSTIEIPNRSPAEVPIGFFTVELKKSVFFKFIG